MRLSRRIYSRWRCLSRFVIRRVFCLISLMFGIYIYIYKKEEREKEKNLFADIDECEQPGTCPKPGTCINTLGSFRCICPRGFKLDQSGRFCTDNNECADDSNCEHGCQVCEKKYHVVNESPIIVLKLFINYFVELYGKLSVRMSGRICSTSLLQSVHRRKRM